MLVDKFNQVHPNQAARIYKSVMCWDKRLKETGSVFSLWGQIFGRVRAFLDSGDS